MCTTRVRERQVQQGHDMLTVEKAEVTQRDNCGECRVGFHGREILSYTMLLAGVLVQKRRGRCANRGHASSVSFYIAAAYSQAT